MATALLEHSRLEFIYKYHLISLCTCKAAPLALSPARAVSDMVDQVLQALSVVTSIWRRPAAHVKETAKLLQIIQDGIILETSFPIWLA